MCTSGVALSPSQEQIKFSNWNMDEVYFKRYENVFKH